MEFLDNVSSVLNFNLFTLGSSQITLMVATVLVLASFLLIAFSKITQRWIVHKLMAHSAIDVGVRNAVASLVRYVFLILGFIVIFQSAGLDLSAFSILFGALGVGVGFGLQAITNNFMCGLIILFERPIKLGDRVEVGQIIGDVINISMRATTIRTKGSISVIVPNTEFITSTVINWSHHNKKMRFTIPVGVSYKEDPQKIHTVLLDVAREEPGVLDNPLPVVLFDNYGDSALNFNLSVWTEDYMTKPAVLRSNLYFAIFDRFRKEGIEIPYPQRDIHIIDMPKDSQVDTL